MKVTEAVLEDLMPIFLADEASYDTRTLVEEYLKENPGFAKKYKQLNIKLPNNINIPLKKEDQLKAFLKVKRLKMIQTIVLAIVFSGGFLLLLSFIALLTQL